MKESSCTAPQDAGYVALTHPAYLTFGIPYTGGNALQNVHKVPQGAAVIISLRNLPVKDATPAQTSWMALISRRVVSIALVGETISTPKGPFL